MLITLNFLIMEDQKILKKKILRTRNQNDLNFSILEARMEQSLPNSEGKLSPT